MKSITLTNQQTDKHTQILVSLVKKLFNPLRMILQVAFALGGAIILLVAGYDEIMPMILFFFILAAFFLLILVKTLVKRPRIMKGIIENNGKTYSLRFNPSFFDLEGATRIEYKQVVCQYWITDYYCIHFESGNKEFFLLFDITEENFDYIVDITRKLETYKKRFIKIKTGRQR